MTDLSKLSEPLPITAIDFRVQSINKGGYATILAYKDARVDMERLDKVCTPQGWQRKHLRENHNCVVAIWCDKKEQWISKEDTGTESNTEAQKGLASDSFKRACFNWGIGRELYDYPVISIKLNGGKDQKDEWYMNGDKPKSGWGLKIKEWSWYSEFEGKSISFLAAKDNHSKVRFTWGNRKVGDSVNENK